MASNHRPRRDAGKERFWQECVKQWPTAAYRSMNFGNSRRSGPLFYVWRRELPRRETFPSPSHCAAPRRPLTSTRRLDAPIENDRREGQC